jgi:hypothetical protein
LKSVSLETPSRLRKKSRWTQDAITGAEAHILNPFDAALKRRSSTVLHAFIQSTRR